MGFMRPVWLFNSTQGATFPRYHPRYTSKTSNHTTNTKLLYWSKQPHDRSAAIRFSISRYVSEASKIWISTLPFYLYVLFLVIITDSYDLTFSPGALYSRKFTIDGEQISLQVQDTPFVSLEVKHLLSARVLSLVCCQHFCNSTSQKHIRAQI